MELCSCFQRFEQKYLLDTDTYQKLRLELTPYMESDQYGISHISSIYFDTPDRRLVRSSLEKPVYKGKSSVCVAMVCLAPRTQFTWK